MIDTGAGVTAIQAGTVSALGLNPVGVQTVTTPSSTNVLCQEFAVRLLFPKNIIYQGTVIEAPLQGQHIQALLGRDVLAFATLVYVGSEGFVTIGF